MQPAERTIEVLEQERQFFAPDQLPLDCATALLTSGYFDVDWANPLNGYRTGVTSRGWVGHIAVAPDFMVRVTPKVPVRQLFELLEVAYNLKSFRFMDGVTDAETVEGLVGRLAMILARRVTDRVRRGLYGNYQDHSADLAAVRGRVDVVPTALRFTRGSPLIQCHYDEFSRDVIENQILLWTLYRVARLGGIRAEVKWEVMQAFRAMAGVVALTPRLPKECINRIYNRLNADYKPLHALCRLLLENLGPGMKCRSRDLI